MALIGYTITVVAKQDNPYNVLPETDISIRKNSDNTLVNIYADEAGLIPIAQLGAKTDSNGQFTFYADASLGVLKAVWTNGGVIATEVLDQNDHSRLVNRNAVGAHDAIYARMFSSVNSMLSYSGLTQGQRYSTGGTIWEYTGLNSGTLDDFSALTDVNVRDFGFSLTDDSSIIQTAIDSVKPNTVLTFIAGRYPFRIKSTIVVTKPLVLKGAGNHNQIDAENPAYGDTASILVDDGIVAFVCGVRTGVNEDFSSVAYDSGRIVFDGLTARPVTPKSTNTVMLQLNSLHNFEIRNCLFRYFDAAVDVTGAYGADIHHNIFASNNYGVIANPDYSNGFGNPFRSNDIIGWETNDINIHHNSFGGNQVTHVYFNCYGHVLNVYSNSMEQSTNAIVVSGYSGSKTEIYSSTWYTFNEYGNYFESVTGASVTLGGLAKGTVQNANLRGSYISVGSEILKHLYCKINRVNGISYKSPDIFALPSGFTDYNEIAFNDASGVSILQGKCDISLTYKYTGVFNTGDAERPLLRLIRQDSAKTDPVTVYVNPSNSNAIGRFDTGAGGSFLSSDWDAGKSGKPFKDLTSLSDWLNRYPLGAYFMNSADSIVIDITGSTGSIGTLSDVNKIPKLTITSTSAVDAAYSVTNCSKLWIKSALTNTTTTPYYGKMAITGTDVICEGVNFNATAAAQTASAWFSLTDSSLQFVSCTRSGVAGMNYIARLKRGSIIYTDSALNAAASVSNAVVDSGNAAQIVNQV